MGGSAIILLPGDHIHRVRRQLNQSFAGKAVHRPRMNLDGFGILIVIMNASRCQLMAHRVLRWRGQMEPDPLAFVEMQIEEHDAMLVVILEGKRLDKGYG